FADLHFTRSQMKEIRYAALLHDFGKVGVREEVLVKAKKLYGPQMDLVRQRFQLVVRSLEASSLRQRLEYALNKGSEAYQARVAEFDSEDAAHRKKLEDYLKVIQSANEPSVLPEGHFEQLLEIAAHHFFDVDGAEQALLSMDEVRL